jgi:hypothetical protein
MRVDNQPLFQRKLSINSRLSHFAIVARQPAPISEGN